MIQQDLIPPKGPGQERQPGWYVLHRDSALRDSSYPVIQMYQQQLLLIKSGEGCSFWYCIQQRLSGVVFDSSVGGQRTTRRDSSCGLREVAGKHTASQPVADKDNRAAAAVFLSDDLPQ